MSHEKQPGFQIQSDLIHAYTNDLTNVLGALDAYQRVLEIGSGTGTFTRYLISQGLSVTAVDRDTTILEETRHQFPDTPFIVADCESANFAEHVLEHSAPFDLIATRYVIHELSEPIASFALWKPLLRPNGKLLLIENCWIRNDWGWSEWSQKSNNLPLAYTQTWATATYCLAKAGLKVTHCQWMENVNASHEMRTINGFRLYGIVAELAN